MSNKTWIGPVCAVAIILFSLWFRVEYQATTIVDVPMRADAGQYARIGMNLVEHGVFSMAISGSDTPNSDSYRGPGYPILVALAMLLSGEEGWYHYLLRIQAVLGALSVGLTIAIARQWLSYTSALGAGILVAIWPHSVTLAGYILTETLYGFTLLLGIYLLCRARASGGLFLYGLAGLVFAYSALVNPSIVLFSVLIGAFLFMSKQKFALAFLVCALILPIAWSARGMVLATGKSYSGRLMENVLVGMEPDFTYKQEPAALAATARVTDGLERYQDDQLAELKVIFDRLKENPGFFARWYLLQKPLRFWQWHIVHGDGDIYVYPVIISPFHTNPFFRSVASISFGMNVGLLVAAVAMTLLIAVKTGRREIRDRDFPLVLVVLLFVYATVLHTVLTPDPRYATPFRPFEILLAISLLAYLGEAWKKRSKKKME